MKSRGFASWAAAAENVATLLPRARLHPAVVAWADFRSAREGWAVALSGGADSVALLLLLWAHWPVRRRRLTAVHFDHRLRGAESSADARFCVRLCKALGIVLVSGTGRAEAAAGGEAQARRARFAFFERACALHKIKVLWLGHQQDDVAESMLMRLARGSGSGGLAAPRPIHTFPSARLGGRPSFHVRPLLGLKKKEIKAALRAAGAPWREDSSNAAAAYFRNRIRKDVVPRWARASQRDALAGAALSRELVEEDDRALEAWVDALSPVNRGGILDVAGLSGCPRAVVRRSLHRWLLLPRSAGELSRQGFDSLLRAVERGTPFRHSLGSHGFAVIRGGQLRFEAIRKSTTTH